MEFGRHPETSDVSLPPSHPATELVLGGKPASHINISIGYPAWGQTHLPGFYPKGIRHHLNYYAQHFNALELNATFYRLFPESVILSWKDSTPDGFRFYPKVSQRISHRGRLDNHIQELNEFIDRMLLLDTRLGRFFLQLPETLGPAYLDAMLHFLHQWPEQIPLGIELRHPAWFQELKALHQLYAVMERKDISHFMVDTPGRRDLLTMRLTTPSLYVRFVAQNQSHDSIRLEEWVMRIQTWQQQGLQELIFILHQDMKPASPFLGREMAILLNLHLSCDIVVPAIQDSSLFQKNKIKQGRLEQNRAFLQSTAPL